MKVVIDTNVFVSSFFGGVPRQIIDLWKQGNITLCLSQPIVDEYLEVLNRLGLKDQDQINSLTALFAESYNAVYTAKDKSFAMAFLLQRQKGSFMDYNKKKSIWQMVYTKKKPTRKKSGGFLHTIKKTKSFKKASGPQWTSLKPVTPTSVKEYTFDDLKPYWRVGKREEYLNM